MRTILFDLEWNYGEERAVFDYHGLEMTFFGEIIQIGAVDADSGETFKVTLRPERFPTLHPVVRELTHLSDERAEGLSIREGLERFRSWCGEDCVLLSWNQKDAPVLKQNRFVQGLREHWPCRFGDVQRLYKLDIGSDKSEPPLNEAVERLGISREIPYHDALADALYAKQVFHCLRAEIWLAEWDRPLMTLGERSRKWRNLREQTLFAFRLSRDSWRCDRELSELRCPHCGGALVPADHWQNGPGNAYVYSMCACPSCGDGEAALVYWAAERDNGLYHFLRGIAVPDKAQKKQWRWKYKRELKKRSAADSGQWAADHR